MNINAGQFNSLRYKNPSTRSENGTNKASLNSNKNTSFGANIVRKFDRKTATVVFENAQELVNRIDNSLGKGYFSGMLENGGFNFDKAKNTLTYTDRTFRTDAIRTVKAAIQIPIKITRYLAKKINPETEVLKKWAEKNEKEKAFNTALDIIEEFIAPSTEFTKKSPRIEINAKKCSEIFENTVSGNITKVKKEYESRDERTLNRVATATVSALYSANDFYNISMLQKDNKTEAKKSHDRRFSQEIKRMALSAGLTFISLGALDRYTKKNIFLNAAVIAVSTLISEIISRVSSGTPLLPLTPEEAAKIAKLKAEKNAQKQNVQQAKTENKVAFKASIKDEKQIYKNFTQKDGNLITQNTASFKANEENKIQENQTKTKSKSAASKILFGMFAGANIIYLLSKALKGQFAFDKAKKVFMAKQGSNIAYDKITPELLEEMKEINAVFEYRKNKYSILDKVKTAMTKKTVVTDMSDLKDRLVRLKATNEGKEISDILDIYLSHINAVKTDKIQSEADIIGVSGLYSGLTKIVETIYTFLSAPAAIVTSIIRKDANNSCKKFDKILAQNTPKYKKELTELGQICLNSKKSDREIVDLIKNRTRNVEIGAETGDLANISRTMVTIITTLFFVNDYRNGVLIESGGKDVKGASEEVKERLMHKLSNFIINGTLMNTFNNVFKGPLNKSLLNAALIATGTETTNEFLVRKSICQPIGKKASKEEIIKYEQEQLNKDGFIGWWARTFKKLTGKKTLTQKAGINIQKTQAHQG